MGKHPFQYIKSEANRKPKEIFPQNPIFSTKNQQIKPFPVVNDFYVKHEGKLNPSLFVIVSGGEKRERDYFKIISDTKSFPRIKIRFVANDSKTAEGGLSPVKMFKEAKRIKRQLHQSKSVEISDVIYLVSDVDLFMMDLLTIKPLCEKEKMNLIISNSCFEVWLYYGYFSSKPTGFETIEQEKVSAAFKSFLPSIKKGGINPVKSVFKMKQAITNAEKNYIEDENGIPRLFSTNMFLLASELYKLVGEGLDIMCVKNNEKDCFFRSGRK